MRSRISILALIIVSIYSVNTDALPTSYYAESSKMATGKWVKISTDSEGIYQFTYDQLREMGFSEPSQVQVYGYGAVQLTENKFSESLPDDITPTATLHTDDGRILFFGQGDASVFTTSSTGNDGYTINRNYYDTKSYYFLSDVAGAQEIPSTQYIANESVAPQLSHIHVELFEDELQTPTKGGVGYHGKQYIPGDQHIQQCQITNFAPTEMCTEGSFAYTIAVGSSRTTTFTLTASSNISKSSGSNKSASNIIDGDYNIYSYASGYFGFRKTPEQPLEDVSVEFAVGFPSKHSADAYNLSYLAIDRTILRYPRANIISPENPTLIMNYIPEEGIAGSIHQFCNVDNQKLVIWNIDSPSAITQYSFDYNADTQTATYSFDRNTSRTIAFLPDVQYGTPQVIGEIPNQDLHSLQSPAMLIITTAEFAPIAERLADVHRSHQAMDVVVAVHDQIYNEFSSGARDAMAYRRMAKMFYDRNPEKFKYIILFGISGYDNRSIVLPEVDRIIAYETTDLNLSRNKVVNYASDNYFGMLADDYEHSLINRTQMQVAVGRIPAITAGQAQSYVNKVDFRFNNPPTPESYARAILIAGEDDKNVHIKHQNEVGEAIKGANPNITLIPIPMQLYQTSVNDEIVQAPHNIIESQLKDGVGYVTFSGHGGQIYISRWHILDTRKASSLDYDMMPFAVFSSCDQFSYDHMQTGLLESMLFKNRGGAIAGVGATREVYITYNQASCVPIAQAYASAKPGDTYGDLFLHSRELTLERAATSSGMLTNAMSYNFGGDPAIPIGVPEYTTLIKSIGDAALSENTTVVPLKPTNVKGEIKDSEGNLIGDFNGTATITILEGATKAETYNTMNENNYTPEEIELNYDVLARCSAVVKNGKFDGSITLPAPRVPNSTYRLIVTATDTESGCTALSSCGSILISEYNQSNYTDSDFEAPEILSLYIDNDSFENGGEVDSTIEVIAQINPSTSGLRLSSSDIAAQTLIRFDNNYISNLARDIKTLENGMMELRTTITGLDEGRHSLSLSVANNAGTIDTESIDFVVVTRAINAVATINELPARTQATISLEGVEYDSNKLIIRDVFGQTVFSAENVAFPYTWNLRNSEDKIVNNGRYSVSVLLRNGTYYGSTPATELIILK